MSKGKTAAQVAHASVAAVLATMSVPITLEWLLGSHAKIILSATEEELLTLRKECDDEGIFSHLVVDQGRTEIPEGSFTTLGIQPLDKEEIDLLKLEEYDLL